MKRILSFLMAVFLMLLSAAGCAQTAVPLNSDIIADTPETENSVWTEKSDLHTQPPTETAVEAQTTEAEDSIKRFFYRESNARIELFSAKINSNEGKEYEIVAYVYCTTGRLDHMPDNEHIYGFTGFDLFEDGVLVDYIEPIVGFLGQVGKKYDKDETEEYFEVIHLDGGDIFACIYPFTEDRHTAKLWYTVYLTVRNGEITFIPRYFTEEEQKAIDESPGLGPCPYDAIYNYYAPRNYRVEGNRIIYTLDADASDEIEGLMQKEVTYPAGEIPVLFDFENNTAKCEKDEYKDVFYMHFDLD